MKNQNGFTLIELVVVIVVLGILAAVAVPKFVDLKDEAKDAALSGVAGNISSASAINYAARSVPADPLKGVATQALTCQAAAAALLEGGVPAGYSLTNDAGSGETNLVAGANTCTLNQLAADGSVEQTTSVVILGVL